MALHFSVNVPSTSAVHVVVMCGRVSAIAFRVRTSTTVKMGVRVYTTLTAMQSLHAQGNLCVCAHGCMYLYNLFVFVCAHVYLHFLFYSCMYNIISHIPLVAPPSIVRSVQTHSWWSLEYLC